MTAGRFRVLAAKGDSAKMPKPNDHLATFFLMCEKISREAAHVICTYNINRPMRQLKNSTAVMARISEEGRLHCIW